MGRILYWLFAPIFVAAVLGLLVPTWGAILFGLLVWLVEAAKANAGSWLLWGIVGAVVGLALAMAREESS
jgi:hypothetical protein